MNIFTLAFLNASDITIIDDMYIILASLDPMKAMGQDENSTIMCSAAKTSPVLSVFLVNGSITRLSQFTKARISLGQQLTRFLSLM